MRIIHISHAKDREGNTCRAYVSSKGCGNTLENVLQLFVNGISGVAVILISYMPTTAFKG